MAPNSGIRRSLAVLGTSCAFATLAVTTAGSVQAAPDTPKPTIASVTAQLASLGHHNEQLTEQFNGAGEEVKAKQREAEAAQRTAAAAIRRFSYARTSLRSSIVAQYKAVGYGQTTALLTSRSGQNYLDQVNTLSVLNVRRGDIAGALRSAESRAEAATKTAAALFADARARRAALAAQRADLQARTDRYRTLLDTLTAEQRRAFLNREIAAAQQRQKAAAAAQAQQAQREAQKQAQTQAQKQAQTQTQTQTQAPAPPPQTRAQTQAPAPPPQTQTQTRAPAQPPQTQAQTQSQSQPQTQPQPSSKAPSVPSGSAAPAPSSQAATAVKFALAQKGKPYVFAASGPDSFDCSGLTMAAWAAAGVSLPHFAETQYAAGHHVSRDQLQPGDLVFFYQPITHVAMYIGNGMIVHAPTEGDVVKVAPLSVFDSDYVGATRLP